MKCPGQDTQYWKPGAIFEVHCPECGASVEFFKDDTTRKCPSCGHRFINPKMDFGCASYCQYAEQCLGDLPPELIAQKEDMLKDRVAVEVKRFFKSDFKKIGHAMRVARYAERIGKFEGGNLAVILSAAYLQEVDGKPVPEEKGNTTEAKKILEKLGAREELIDEVCGILGRSGGQSPEDGVNLQVVYDADRIASLEERQKSDPMPEASLAARIEKELITETGKKEAKKVLL
jgi:hypothetical protein